MHLDELLPKSLDGLAVVEQPVPAQVLQQPQELVGRGRAASSLFGVEWNGADTARLHRLADLALGQGMQGEGDEVEKQEGLDAFGRLIADRHDLGSRLESVMALLDEGLVPVGVGSQQVERRELLSGNIG